MDNAHVSAPDPSTRPNTRYRLANALVLRVLGAQAVALGVLLLGVFAVGALVDLPAVVPVMIALLGILTLTGTAWWLRSRASVVTLTAQGYAVRLLRGSGVRSASWPEVREVVTSSPRGVACVVLRLEEAQTIVPVAALAADREDFVRDLQQRLQSGHGLKPL
ncbi:hypothetical protein GCM10027020_32230 [Nocardioides salsibiostraticola]